MESVQPENRMSDSPQNDGPLAGQPAPDSLAEAPAQCETCFPSQAFWDLVPVFGLLRRGKVCADCGEGRARRWPTVEVFIAALWGVVIYQHGFSVEALVLALFCGVLVYLAMTDLQTTWFPGPVLLSGVLVALALYPFSPLGQDWSIVEAYIRSLAGAGLGGGVMLSIFLASRGRMGGGDITLAALLGAALGFPQIIAGLMLGFVLGGVVGISLILLRLKGLKEMVPYGPSLIGGALALLLVGPPIYNWYLDLFR
ncbi:MAG: prepilin peptidase [Dehalococcoidia bacterium]